MCAHASESGRLDTCVRQMISTLDGPLVELCDAPPSLGGGLGNYLTFRLLGTRRTAFVASSDFSDAGVSREVADMDADRVVAARKLADKGFALDLPVRTALPINSLAKDDGLIAYALAAYLLEGRPEDTAALLRALAPRGADFHAALAETLGTDVEGLEYRFLRWLHEIPAK